MSDHYRYRKDKTHLSSTFKLRIDDYYYLKVYIWNNEEGMYANIEANGEAKWESRDYAACYLGMPHGWDDLEQETLLPKFWGEVHLTLKDIDVEVVTHELTHFLLNWMDAVNDSHEELCLLMGRLNKKFWNAFYQRYKVSEGKSELCQRN